jgi:lysine 2,3-aminomutase
VTASKIKAETLIQVEGEPPLGSLLSMGVEEEEEPPSKRGLSTKEKLFGHVPEKDWNDWKWQFRNRITSVDGLAKLIPLSSKELEQLRLVITRYPFAVTPYYLSLIDLENPDDPIRKQAIPCFDEIAMADMGEEDPLEEKRDSVVPGLVHRYPTEYSWCLRISVRCYAAIVPVKGSGSMVVGSGKKTKLKRCLTTSAVTRKSGM